MLLDGTYSTHKLFRRLEHKYKASGVPIFIYPNIILLYINREYFVFRVVYNQV